MIRAMIFDLDGTLVETEKLKAYSYARAAVDLRGDGLTEAQVIDAFKAVVGLSRREVALYLLDRFGLEAAARDRMAEFQVDLPWEAYGQLRLHYYEALLRDPDLLRANRYPHNITLLKTARQTLGKTGLATMSYCEQVKRVLAVLELGDQFDFVASRDDVDKGKPDPEIYHLVAHKLQVEPHETLVIEDSPTGVQAALNAGMHCIAVTTDFTRETLRTQNLLAGRWIVDDPNTLTTVVQQVMDEQRQQS